jgi:ABC-type uncharacterized transport system involved in gliding motility auxiliary subunit
MPTTTQERRRATLWLVVAGLALLALALGAWDLLIERDGGENWLTQVLMPLLLLVFALVMYRRQKGGEGEPHS